jgi:hypothetical protein
MAFTGLFWMVHSDAQILVQRMMMEGGDWIITRKYTLGYCGRSLRLSVVSHGVHWSFLSGVCRRAFFTQVLDDGGRWLNSHEKIFLGLLRPFTSLRLSVVSHGVHWSFLSGVCRRAFFGSTHDDGGRWLNNHEKIFFGLLRPLASVKRCVAWRSLVFFEWCMSPRIFYASTRRWRAVIE